jgi:hypothetical protein
MSRKFIDISMPLENDVISDPEGYRPKITYINHKQSVDQILNCFPGLEKKDLQRFKRF